MDINKLLASGAVYTPWPVVIDGVIYNGQKMRVSSICSKKCDRSPACAHQESARLDNICQHGLSYFRLNLGAHTGTIFGVRGPANVVTRAGVLKQELKGRTVTPEEVKNWQHKLTSLLDSVEEEFLQRQSEMLDPIHDPIRLANQILTIANRLVQKEFGDSPVDFENASPDVKSLVKAAELLSDSFDLLTIYFNPAAATFGRKSYMPLHGLLYKLVRVLRIQDTGDEGPVRVYLDGECHRPIHAHESFKLIPFALISNAIKYTLSGSVRVRTIERLSSIEVSVESLGPLIEPDEMEAIFQKRKRGRWARSMTTSGTGVGLYLAQIVAEAHEMQIKVASFKQGERAINGIPIALNRFSFEIHA
jgi:hypothetical protein